MKNVNSFEMKNEFQINHEVETKFKEKVTKRCQKAKGIVHTKTYGTELKVYSAENY